MFKKIAVLLIFIFIPLSLSAAEVAGKIQSISLQAKMIQFINPKTKVVSVITFNDQTALESAEEFADLTVNTKFKATVNADMLASKIKRILVKLPENLIIDTDQLSDLIDQGTPLFIGDARPVGPYNLGHLPGAVSTPANKLAENINWLPKDKNRLLVFYCGGVTCPLSPKAMKIAQKQGYKNVKAYVEGYPAWKEDVYPVHVNALWLSKNLDKHHIIIDVRENVTDTVKGALHLPLSQLSAQHDLWNKEKYPTSKRTIFDLRDKKAPITIVADIDSSDQAVEAYELLTFWNFKNTAILKGGLIGWSAKQLPVEKLEVNKALNYVKKLAKGAIDEKAFVNAVKSGDATIIDLRSIEDVSQGHLPDSINISIDNLNQNMAKIPQKGLVIIHCIGGSRAAIMYALLTKKGYRNIKYLDDTFADVVQDNNLKLVKS